MSLESLCINTVTVTRKTWSNVRGERTASPSTEDLAASVQPMRADRAILYGLTAGVTGWVAYFSADPEVRTDDLITWGDRKLSVLASPRDAAGRSVLWAVDCKEVK